MPPTERVGSLVPGSATVTWRRAGDVRVLLAAGYALLLQVSHPTVGAGVSEHSRFRTDPWGRLLRTLDYSCTMVYAGAEQAGEMGQRIREFHKQIRGVRPDGVPLQRARARGLRVGPRDPRRRDRAGPRALRRAALGSRPGTAVGRVAHARAPARDPRSRPSTHVAGVPLLLRRGPSRTHCGRTAAVEEVLDALAHPAPPELSRAYRPLWSLTSRQFSHVISLATAGLLPAGLRERFGIPWGRGRELELRALAGSAAGRHARDAGLPAEHRARLSAVAQPGARAGRGGLRPARLSADAPGTLTARRERRSRAKEGEVRRTSPCSSWLPALQATAEAAIWCTRRRPGRCRCRWLSSSQPVASSPAFRDRPVLVSGTLL